MVPGKFDQITEETSSEAASDRGTKEEERREAHKRGIRSEVWRVKPKVDEEQPSGSSAAPINMVFMLPS